MSLTGLGASITGAALQRLNNPANSGMAAIQQQTDRNNAWSAQQAAGLRDWQQQQNQQAMEFNAAEASKNRDWQKMMSDTAHQREIKDLIAAGLNPILSVTGGQGAAVGSGSQASGVTSSGAMGGTDESGAMAIVSLLGNLLGSQTMLENQRMSAASNEAIADKYTAMSELVANVQSEASKYASDASVTSAGIHAAATKYAADKNADTAITVAGINQATQKYGADIGRMSAREIAAFNAEVNKYLQSKGQQHDFDIREMYPSNAWEYSGGQANARDWTETITGGIRDLGIGIGGMQGLFGGGTSAKSIIGFR